MAEDISGNARELADAMAEVQRELARYGKVSAETADRLTDAQMKAKYGIENFSKGVGKATDAVGSLAAAGIEAGKAMYEGKKGAAAFNSSLDQLSAAATAAGTALALLIPGGFIIKGLVAGLTMATTAAIAYTKAANDMADKLYTGYSKLQESGAAAADGMTGVFNDAKKLGLSMNQLDSMIGLISNNSQELALLTGSVAEGRKKFADMGEALESSRVGFFNMGISQEAQNEGMMRYVKNMTLAGRAQNMTTKELTDGARAYIYEQDKLTKLTGISAQKQQAILDRARESEQFNAKIRSLERAGDAESLATADRLRKGLIMAAAAGDGVAEGFMASVNNNLKNQKAQELFTTSYGGNLKAVQDILAGMNPEEALMPMFKSIAEFEKTQGNQLSMLEAGNGKFLKSSEQANAALIAELGYDEALRKIEAEQLRQREAKGDAVTAEYSKMLKTQQEINAKLERDVFKGIPNALANMQRLADVTDKLADVFSSLTTGLNKLLNLVGLGVKEDKVAGKQKEIEKTQEALAKAQTDQVNAKTEIEKINAARETKFYAEKLAALRDEKDVVSKKEEVSKMEADIIKRAEEERKIARAKRDKVFETATAAQKAGFGQDDAMKEASKEYLAADKRVRELQAFGGALAKKEARRAGAGAGAATSDASDNRFARQGTPAPAATGAEPAAAATPSGAAAKGAPSATTGTPGGAKPEDVLQFTGKSGQRQNFDGLNESMKTALVAAGQQYFEQTGQKLQMNSAFRSPEDQKRLYQKTLDAGTPGVDPNTKMPVAPPGKSSHETGNAVDIQNYSDPKAVAAMNAQGLRQTVPKDPVHFQLQAADGGVFSGPDSGYPIIAHGDEAVVPLNNGGGNFVKVFEDMAMMMGKQVGAIDELIRIAKNGNDIQTKILRIQS